MTDVVSGRSKLNVTVPLQLVKIGLRIAERFAPDAEINWQELEEAITGNLVGKLVEVEDEEDHERIEVFVE